MKCANPLCGKEFVVNPKSRNPSRTKYCCNSCGKQGLKIRDAALAGRTYRPRPMAVHAPTEGGLYLSGKHCGRPLKARPQRPPGLIEVSHQGFQAMSVESILREGVRIKIPAPRGEGHRAGHLTRREGRARW